MCVELGAGGKGVVEWTTTTTTHVLQVDVTLLMHKDVYGSKGMKEAYHIYMHDG